MKDELNQKLTESLVGILEKLEQGLDFAIAEVPDVVLQMMTYKTIVFSIGVISALAVVCASAWYYFKFLPRKYTEANGKIDAGIFSMAILIGMPATISTVLFFINLFDLLKIVVAPKLFIIEYVRSLM